MDNELKDTGTRNWVKTWLALRCFKEAILPFMKDKCDQQYRKDIHYIKQLLGLPEYTCNLCKIDELKPIKKKTTKVCPDKGSCGHVFNLIKDAHVKKEPNWSNTNSEFWSDNIRGPWERMKSFIHTSGYKEKKDILEADITAFVQICTNNAPLNSSFGSDIVCLEKVRDIRNAMCHSGSMTVAGSEFLTYIKDIETALKLTIFDGFPAVKDELQKLHILENDKACVTVEDEIEAREEILKAIKDIKCLIQMQQEGLAETDANIDSIRHQLANLASAEFAHIEHIQLRFQDIETHLNKLRDEHMKENEQLQKHKAILESISDAVTIQAAGIKRIQKTLEEEFKPILKKNEGNSEALGRLEKKVDFLISIKGHSPECALDSKVIVNTNTAGNQEAVSNLLVKSANEITGDGPFTKLKNGIKTAFEKIQNGGGQITQVKHECMAIYMRFPTLQSWLEFHRRYLNGEIDGYFQPIQQHLRTYLGYDDLELTVDIYEEDFTANVQSIMYELEATTEVNDETYFAKQTSDTGFNAAPMPPQRDHRTSVSISKSEGQAMSEEMAAMEVTIKQLRECLKEREDRIEAIIEARTKEKERDLQKLFAEKERQLHETQITLSRKLGETEQPVAALTNKTIEQLRERLKEMEDHIEAIAEARTKEKERDLQKLFAEKERQLQETQITVSRKLGETEQPVAALTNDTLIGLQRRLDGLDLYVNEEPSTSRADPSTSTADEKHKRSVLKPFYLRNMSPVDVSTEDEDVDVSQEDEDDDDLMEGALGVRDISLDERIGSADEINDTRTGVISQHKKWLDVPYDVQELGLEDFWKRRRRKTFKSIIRDRDLIDSSSSDDEEVKAWLSGKVTESSPADSGVIPPSHRTGVLTASLRRPRSQ